MTALSEPGGASRSSWHAHKFLQQLENDPNAVFHFRTLGERTKGGARTYSGTFAECHEKLLADNQAGFGVFVVVNAGGQVASDIHRVRAVFADCDNDSSWSTCCVAGRDPHIVVQTSPSRWHAYWLVSDMPLSEFKSTQIQIAAAFGTDASITDLPRLMRLPGFFHHKREPHPVRMLAWSEGRPLYSAHKLRLRAWGLPDPLWGIAVPDVVLKGNRNTELARIAGILRNKGRDYAEIVPALKGVPVEGALDPGEVERIAKSVCRYEPGNGLTRDKQPRAAADGACGVGGLGGLGGVTALDVVTGSDVTPEPIDWLWNHWLAVGKFHLLAGAPGCGKTTSACSLASIVTQGGLWPDGTSAEQGDVLMWSGEDDIANTLIPRFHACGADLTRVHLIRGVQVDGVTQCFDPAIHLPLLEASMATLPNIRMLIVDPIVSAVLGDSHKNVEVRRSLQPLADLAASRGIALIGITHFSKSTQGRNPTERVTGSIAFSALARVVLVAAATEKSEGGQEYLLARSKSNIGPSDGGFSYRLSFPELSGFPGVIGSCVHWGEKIEGSARDILGATENVSSGIEPRREAKAWLAKRLSEGPVLSNTLKIEAEQCGFPWRTLERAKKDISAKSRKNSTDAWEWWIPPIAEGLSPPPLPTPLCMPQHD